MRLFLPTILLLASTVCNAFNQANTTDSTPSKKCYTLNDPKAPFFSPTTKSLLDNQVFAGLVLQGIGQQFPELSKCLASSDPVTTLLPLYFAEDSQKCLKVLMGQENGSEMMDGSTDPSESRHLQKENMEEWMKKLKALFKSDGSEAMGSGSEDAMDDMMEKGKDMLPMFDDWWSGGKKKNSSMTEEQKTMFATTLCPLIDSTFIPCVNSLAPALESIIKAGGSCCNDLKSLITEWVGSDISTFIKTMSTAMQAALCSKNAKTGVVCGDAWTTYIYELEKSIQEGDNMMKNHDQSAIEKLLQLPNSEVCNAMTGKAFKTTTGEKCMNEVNSTVDICYEPFDNLMTKISSLPVIEKMNLTDIFADGKCLDTEKMHKNFNMTMEKNSTEHQLPFLGKLLKDLEMKKDDDDDKSKKMCLHIPNSVDSCKFVGTLSSDDSGSGIVDADEIEVDSSAMSVMFTKNFILATTTLVSMIVIFA